MAARKPTKCKLGSRNCTLIDTVMALQARYIEDIDNNPVEHWLASIATMQQLSTSPNDHTFNDLAAHGAVEHFSTVFTAIAHYLSSNSAAAGSTKRFAAALVRLTEIVTILPSFLQMPTFHALIPDSLDGSNIDLKAAKIVRTVVASGLLEAAVAVGEAITPYIAKKESLWNRYLLVILPLLTLKLDDSHSRSYCGAARIISKFLLQSPKPSNAFMCALLVATHGPRHRDIFQLTGDLLGVSPRILASHSHYYPFMPHVFHRVGKLHPAAALPLQLPHMRNYVPIILNEYAREPFKLVIHMSALTDCALQTGDFAFLPLEAEGVALVELLIQRYPDITRHWARGFVPDPNGRASSDMVNLHFGLGVAVFKAAGVDITDRPMLYGIVNSINSRAVTTLVKANGLQWLFDMSALIPKCAEKNDDDLFMFTRLLLVALILSDQYDIPHKTWFTESTSFHMWSALNEGLSLARRDVGAWPASIEVFALLSLHSGTAREMVSNGLLAELIYLLFRNYYEKRLPDDATSRHAFVQIMNTIISVSLTLPREEISRLSKRSLDKDGLYRNILGTAHFFPTAFRVIAHAYAVYAASLLLPDEAAQPELSTLASDIYRTAHMSLHLDSDIAHFRTACDYRDIETYRLDEVLCLAISMAFERFPKWIDWIDAEVIRVESCDTVSTHRNPRLMLVDYCRSVVKRPEGKTTQEARKSALLIYAVLNASDN